MNANERRKHRRKVDRDYVPEGCGQQGYSGTTHYPDLMCTDGRMTDMDGDGPDPETWRPPCQHCNPTEHAEWMRELIEEMDQETA